MLSLGKERDELSIINDQHCTPTSTKDLATAIAHLIQMDQFGLYNITNEGQTSWYELARCLFDIVGIDVKTNAITTEEYNAPAERPRFSVLDCSRLKKVCDFSLPYWKDALKRYLES